MAGIAWNSTPGTARDEIGTLKLIKMAAERLNPLAMRNLGWIYQIGLGVTRDYVEALQWYRRAAENGLDLGQFSLGVMYENGWGVEQNYDEAVKWYTLASKQGCADGHCSLGYMYAMGRGVSLNLDLSVMLYRRAAEKNLARAKFLLGQLYEEGKGVPQDYSIAMTWYNHAAEQGDPRAQFKIAIQNEFGVDENNDHQKAISWYRLAAKTCYTLRQSYLGQMYQIGIGKKAFQNIFEDVEWYRLAAIQEIEQWQCLIGQVYRFDQNFPQDYKRIKSRFKVKPQTVNSFRNKIFVLGFPAKRALPEDGFVRIWYYFPIDYDYNNNRECDLEQICSTRNECSSTETDIEKLYSEAREQYLLEKQQNTEIVILTESPGIVDCSFLATKQLDSQLLFKLGNAYEFGIGVLKNLTKAVAYYTLAAEKGHATAQWYLGEIYETGRGVISDYTLALDWYHKAAKQDDVLGQFKLGIMSATGRGIPQNHSEALKWYVLAAKKGLPAAQFCLGELYEFGYGVSADINEAINWYISAADGGERRAQCKLGWICIKQNNLAERFSIAAEWFFLAAKQGDHKAQTCLGYMFRNGLGITWNFTEAKRWVRQAAERGNCTGQYLFGILYLRDMPINKHRSNLTIAKKWLRRSAEQGHVLAQEDLGYICKNGVGSRQNISEAYKFYAHGIEQGSDIAKVGLEGLSQSRAWEQQLLTSEQHEAIQSSTLNTEPKNAEDYFMNAVNHRTGNGLPVDINEAVKWYRKAAEQGHIYAQTELAYLHRTGFGVPQNEAESVRWYRLAAEKGCIEAQYELGLAYHFGWGVTQDYVEALKWYRQAADQGSVEAQDIIIELYDKGSIPVGAGGSHLFDLFYGESVRLFNLGEYKRAQRLLMDVVEFTRSLKAKYAVAICLKLLSKEDIYQKWIDAEYPAAIGEQLIDGIKCKTDYKIGLRLLTFSAESNDIFAQASLGLRLYRGEGVPANKTEGLKWICKVADQGNILFKKYERKYTKKTRNK